MATYRFPRMLTLLAWEAELRHGPYASEWSWSLVTPGDQLNLDFSRVEFADFGALARALLLLDAAAKAEIPATVTLPTTSVFTAIEPDDTEAAIAARQARARGDALSFMRQVGFLDALRAPHWSGSAVRVLDRATAGAQESGPSAGNLDLNPYRAPYRPRRVFPFRWLEPMPAAQLRESESFFAVSAALEDLGLSQSDARTLSQTVLTELVENVAEHGSVGDRPSVALVGAILLTAESYALRQNGMHPHMAEVAERALADRSQVLRLIVADSGADLAGSLAPMHGPQGIDWDATTDRRRQESILSALGNRSAAATGADARRVPTGLWWVARVVRSYHGGVQARTANLLAGVLFGREADGTSVAEAGLGYVPGTLLELTLPTGPSPPRPRMPWGSRSVPGAARPLRWVSCAFDPQRGLSAADRQRLTELAIASGPESSADGLIVTVPLHDAHHTNIDRRWRGAIYQILEFVSSVAHSEIVVVAFPDAAPHMLGPCVAAFNEELAAGSGEDAHDPILVLGCHGDRAWCGGSIPLRAVLNALADGEGAVDAVEATESWRRAGGEPTRFLEMLLANDHLLHMSGGRLQLRLSLSAVHATVEQAVSRNLAKAIGQGSAGVERGTFRGPTLRTVNRWMHVEQLLTATVGVQLAAFVLARKVEAALRASAQAETPTGIFQVRSAPRPLARQLSECLTLGGHYYPQPSELNIGEPPIGEQVPVGAKVILCTDVICTENTVRRAVAMVAGRNANPLVIACVVDARDSPGPVRLLNRVIPVVSLTEVKVRVGASADQDVVDIDPLMLRPEVPASAEPTAEETDLLTWFATDPDVVRLGHIDDPPRRHYSAFIRLQAMRQQERRDQITDAVLSNMRQALEDIRAQGHSDSSTDMPISVWYVASDGNAGLLAEIVRDCLAADGWQLNGVTPVPRWTAGDAWAFPTTLSTVSQPVGVLIIHWWAITGSTLLQLVRLAAKSGASWIIAVCMLNQLHPNDADALLMLRTVAVPAAVAAGNGRRPAADPRPAEVPVAIRFVAANSITAFDAYGCPMCAARERYLLGDENVPTRLINHADLLRDMLRPRELDEVSRDSAADLFTVPVTGYEAVDYLRWRGLLLRALRTVGGRQEVIDRLRTLVGETPPEREWTSNGLIRLLAAEQQWLRSPPLYFEIAADLLSQVCLRGFEQVTASPWLRVQAFMVISAAAPDRLVDLLPRLLTLAGNEAVLIDQMLLDCCWLLIRPSGHLPIDMVQLRHNLLVCRDYLEEQRAEPRTAAAEDHLHAVRSLLTIADYRVLSKPKAPQAAWEHLREDLVGRSSVTASKQSCCWSEASLRTSNWSHRPPSQRGRRPPIGIPAPGSWKNERSPICRRSGRSSAAISSLTSSGEGNRTGCSPWPGQA